jgi:predicted acetyltransferase
VINQVTLIQVPANQSAVIINLMQLYQHDFSEFANIGSEYGEIGPDGRFVYEGLDRYWQEDSRIPFAVHADGRLAGFILVNRWSALDRPLDHAVAEFFVMRKYRRNKVGSRAAKSLFANRPGRWEVAVAGYNQPALAFWRKAIPASVDVPVHETAGDGKRWSGKVLCFNNAAT